MPIITIRFKDKKIRDYPLAVGQTCTIGRKSSNDIVIDNLAVSGNHARIESVSTTFVIRDLDSTNGTFVNKKKVSLYNLRHGDVLLIGKHELIFDRSDLMNKKGGTDQLDDDKTRILDTTEYRTLMHEEANRGETDKGQISSSPSAVKRFFKWLFR
jgi:pSer/pThr/pTyr-binding forkhead associated (FHA) protein